MVDEREIGQRIKNDLIGIIKGTGEVAGSAVGSVSDLAQKALSEAVRLDRLPPACNRCRQGLDSTRWPTSPGSRPAGLRRR